MSEIERTVLAADLIHVGGGNTLRMMKLWRKLGVDRYIEKAARQGTVLAGLSAGANCWYQWGHLDSRSFAEASEWSYIRVRGLGLCSGGFCPHLDSERRHRPFSEVLGTQGGIGAACADNAAVWYRDGKDPLVKCSRRDATVRLYRRAKGKVVFETFQCYDELKIGADV